jgi:hypothetical protein
MGYRRVGLRRLSSSKRVAMSDTRVRLIHCETCGQRSWLLDDEPVPPGTDEHTHDWWEGYTLFMRSNGPGLHPAQVGPR